MGMGFDEEGVGGEDGARGVEMEDAGDSVLAGV